jgi:hypothetical protein
MILPKIGDFSAPTRLNSYKAEIKEWPVGSGTRSNSRWQSYFIWGILT